MKTSSINGYMKKNLHSLKLRVVKSKNEIEQKNRQFITAPFQPVAQPGFFSKGVGEEATSLINFREERTFDIFRGTQ